MQKPVQRIAMKAVIVNDDDKLLVVREAKSYEDGTQVGKYHFPGGRIEPGENHIEGLKREVLEEVGLSIEPGYPIHIDEWQPVIKGVPHQIIAIFVLCRSKSTKVKIGPDSDDYIWLDPTKDPGVELMNADVKAIKAYQQNKMDKS